MLSRSTKVLLALLLLVATTSYWLAFERADEPLPVPEDAVPPGRWTRVPVQRAGDGDHANEDLVSLLSLPYLEGKVEAGETAGVTVHEAERAWEGLNLYCSGHAPEALLMDMDGRVLHRWRLPFGRAFPDRPRNQESAFFRRVALLPGGELLALFHGTGLVKLDRDSRLLWAKPIAAFNDFWVAPDGGILVLAKEARVIPSIDPEEPVLEDFVVELGPDGKEIERLSLLELFRRPPWGDLLAGMERRGDILHSNTVTRLDGRAPQPWFAEGNLLVSLRQVDVIGVIDRAGERVVWALDGSWRRQHEPVVLSDGDVLLFDNRGSPGGGARVLEIEPESGEIAWSFGDAPGQELYSPEGGSVARLPNGNTLITASESGRVIEVAPDDEIVWEFLSPHRAGPNRQLVATLWEMQRIEPDRVGWLEGR